MVTIDDFAKLDIRIVKILEVVKMEGSDKLLKLTVDDGEGQRQILSGIGKSYQPEELVGKSVAAIVNLEPRMMMGEESQGMILATGETQEDIALLTSLGEPQPGSKVR